MYEVNTDMSCNVIGLSEDLFLAEQMAWAKAAAATPTEEALAKKKAYLIECGLPEAQAAASVATDLPGGYKETAPSSCFCESFAMFRLDKVDLVSHRFYFLARRHARDQAGW